MKITRFSPKQKLVLNWWRDERYLDFDAVICDGAVRSGKTLSMGISFILWAMSSFNGRKFGLCGKTITSLRRNVIDTVLPVIGGMGLECRDKLSQNLIVIKAGARENTFHLFGGKDEGAASHIQGITFAGVFFDEVALMPESFVEQALARCSVEGSRFWFNCNPEGPSHWFYTGWIQKRQEKKALYIHFTMKDNPSLTKRIRERYERLYTGAFYERFVLGKWCGAEGRVYDFFDESFIVKVPEGTAEKWYISCDYGTANPASFGLWGLFDGVWYRVKEYYFSSKREGYQKTDEEYADELERLRGERRIEGVIVDPSAASFIETLRRRGFLVVKAKNDVISGIRLTADALKSGWIKICSTCTDSIREFSLYVWEPRGGDVPKKENDHSMDEIRYFVSTVLAQKEDIFFASFIER